jgi:aminopeptidase N
MRTFVFFALTAFISFSTFAQNWDWGGNIDPLQERFEVKQYRLELEIIPDLRVIRGSNTITFHSDVNLDTLRLNLIDAYRVSKVVMNDNQVGFNHHDDLLDIFPEDCTCTSVQVFYEGSTPIAQNPPWLGGFTWEIDAFQNHWMGLSSQGEGAKIFMPALDHPSSEPSEGVELIFRVPKPYFVASNGNLIEVNELDDQLEYHWSTTYPINNYNINFTMGVFHEERLSFQSVSGDVIPMHVWVLQEDRKKAKELIQNLKTSTETLEKYFGAFPFPKDKIAVVQTPFLGMEHQTINAYGSDFQSVKMGGVGYDWLLHHELGHEWFGNKISVGDWADMWIHEGLTAFGDWLFYWEHGGEQAYFEKVKSVAKTIEHLKPVISPPNSTEKEAYHPEIYTKGAFLVHSLRGIIGDEVFFPMLKAFASDDRFTYLNRVKSQDFFNFVGEYTSLDLQKFVNFYFLGTNLPQLKITKKRKSGFEVSLKGIDFQIPVEIKTSTGIERVILGSKPVLIKSQTYLDVDPRGWLLLRR